MRRDVDVVNAFRPSLRRISGGVRTVGVATRSQDEDRRRRGLGLKLQRGVGRERRCRPESVTPPSRRPCTVKR